VIITEKQLLFLLRNLEDTLKFRDNANIFGYNTTQRINMYNTIINQQNGILKTKKEIKNKEL
jgi:hypothetical protein